MFWGVVGVGGAGGQGGLAALLGGEVEEAGVWQSIDIRVWSTARRLAYQVSQDTTTPNDCHDTPQWESI